jgi:hypothetical protein
VARVLDETVGFKLVDMVGVGAVAVAAGGAVDAAAHSPALELAPFFEGTNDPASRACESGLASLQRGGIGGHVLFCRPKT